MFYNDINIFLDIETTLNYYVMESDEHNSYAQDTPLDENFYVYIDHQ